LDVLLARAEVSKLLGLENSVDREVLLAPGQVEYFDALKQLLSQIASKHIQPDYGAKQN